ncbi:site-specific integrase, partial [Acinetobacter guillouiae]|uniref:site-specific integrase n=1 Tax=Acinetobacter guillouiae TaxID=106649 RepID=UPI003008BFA1
VKLWLSTSPLDDVKFPSDSNHRERVISDEEIGIMMGGLDSVISNIFLFALETGMRQSEICEMTWDRVYITKRFVRLTSTKNGRLRDVPLSSIAIDILTKIGVKKTGSIFNRTAYEVSDAFRETRIRLGLEGFTFHDARHTAATRIALKIPLLDLCKMFGWSNPKRAMTYYNPTASEIALRL